MNKTWQEKFEDEFGIHFKNSPDELKFAISFIEEVIKEESSNAYWEAKGEDGNN